MHLEPGANLAGVMRGERTRMAKFVLIDQSITDVGGHHHEYADRVLRAASAAGYEPILATHRSYERDAADPWAVHRVYRYGFWQQPLKRRWFFRPASRGRLWWHKTKVRLYYSPVGYLWQSRREGASLLSRLGPSGLGPVSLALLAIPAILAMVILKGWRLLMGLIPAALRAYSVKLVRGVLKLLLLPFFPFVLALRKRAGIVKALRTRLKRRAFGQDTARLLRRIRPSRGDIIFIPTISELEMSGLAGVMAPGGIGAAASWRLLFRRNLYAGRPADYPSQDEWLRPVRNMFRELSDAASGCDLRCYTDTDELTAQWNRLGAMSFETLPIPVDEGYHSPRGRRGGPLHAVYAGDAREEKGFHLLPGLVRDLQADLFSTGRVRLVAQAYYNSEPGEPGARIALGELEERPREQVTLVRKALSGNDYRDHVTRADIALIPYHRDNYSARSSGIFTEAAAAGIPTLVPAGSWMAIQLEGPTHAAHARILASTPIIHTLEGEDLGWFIEGGRGANPMHDGRLVLSGSRDRCVKVMVPPRASHVHVAFVCRMDQARDFVGIRVMQPAGGARHKRPERLISAEHEGRHSRLIRLAPGTREITLGFSPAFTDTMGILSSVRLTFLSSATPLPRFGAGVIYDDDQVMAEGLREIVEQIEHYRTTAREFADQWRALHTPTRLVEALRSPRRAPREDKPNATIAPTPESRTHASAGGVA